MATFQLGVLDFVRPIEATLELVVLAEQLGYSRYWITEHPPQPNPQLTLALLAGTTDSIRVGTAGILLRFHNPFAAAQNFLMLEKMFPGRIDAGYCAGRSSNPALDAALLDGRVDRDDPDDFARRAEALVDQMRGASPLPSWSQREGAPLAWTFGTGESSARLAARLGTAFGYSLCHGKTRDDTFAVDLYREHFQPSETLAEPLVAVAVAGVCAETEARAIEMRAEHVNDFISPTIVGAPQACAERLADIAARYNASDIVFLDVCRRYDDRASCYRLLAEACGLDRAEKRIAA